jgi:Sulfotransferase family
MTIYSPEKTFILGIGTGKAGTTWLYNYLHSYEQINLGFKKEYHVFDAIYVKSCHQYAKQAPKVDTKTFLTSFEKKAIAQEQLLALFQNNHNNYYDYFAGLVDNEKTCFTGDITPSYCCLEKSVFAMIKAGIASRGLTLKVIFILRDPVEKIWSASRMYSRLGRLYNSERLPKNITIEQLVLLTYKADITEEMTRYSKIIKTLEAVFSESELYIGFFETMFLPNEILNLSNFLGLKPNYDLSLKKSNASPKLGAELSPDISSLVARYYADEYEFCNNLFENVDLRSLWQSYAYL